MLQVMRRVLREVRIVAKGGGDAQAQVVRPHKFDEKVRAIVRQELKRVGVAITGGLSVLSSSPDNNCDGVKISSGLSLEAEVNLDCGSHGHWASVFHAWPE